MESSLITTASPDNQAPAETNARMTRLLEGLVARRRAHHVTVSVQNGAGDRRWSAATLAAGSAGEKLDPDTPFFAASITKRFIITLVLQLHERGELDLGERIREYLPEETISGLHVLGGVDRGDEITVRHLASHTSGLPDYFEKRRGERSLMSRLATGDDVGWTFEDALRIVREQQRPHFVPQDLAARHQKARYSDTGFQMLIRIIESVSGRAFPNLLQQHILEPLRLTNTWHSGREWPTGVPAPPSLYARQRRLHVERTLASTNDLYSTTADLLVFQRALLAGRLFEDPATVSLLTERRNRLRNAPVLSYGLGTMYFTVRRPRALHRPLTLIGHSGSTGTWLFHCPELDLHLAGSVDQGQAQAMPFRIMARCLSVWE